MQKLKTQILNLLVENRTISNYKISKRIGNISESTVQRARKELEEELISFFGKNYLEEKIMSHNLQRWRLEKYIAELHASKNERRPYVLLERIPHADPRRGTITLRRIEYHLPDHNQLCKINRDILQAEKLLAILNRQDALAIAIEKDKLLKQLGK